LIKEAPELEDSSLDPEGKMVNLCREIPANGVTYINLLTKLCSKCSNKAIMDSAHLHNVHGVKIPEPLNLLRRLQADLGDKIDTRVSRMLEVHHQFDKIVKRIHSFLAEDSMI